MEIKMGEKLQAVRKRSGHTQKEFAEFIGVPQSSLSAYENNKNLPTTEVMIAIANKCNVSLDWLCGLAENSNIDYNLNEFTDISNIMYKLMELNEIGITIKSNKPDMETDEDKWSVNLTIYGNDSKYALNSDLCQLLESVGELNLDVESFEVDAETYELKKERDLSYYKNHPLTKRVIPELTREERIKKRNEWLEKQK